MNDKQSVTVDEVVEAARRTFKVKDRESLVNKWAKRAGVSAPSVRSFIKADNVKPATVDRIVRPLGYQTEVVIKERDRKTA